MVLSLGAKVPDFSLPSTSVDQFTFENYRGNQVGWHLIAVLVTRLSRRPPRFGGK